MWLYRNRIRFSNSILDIRLRFRGFLNWLLVISPSAGRLTHYAFRWTIQLRFFRDAMPYKLFASP